MSFCGLIANFVLLLNNIPLYRHDTICLFLHLLKNILINSNVWQLWIKLLWTLMWRFLYGHKLSAHLVKYLRIAGFYGKTIFSFIRNCETVFQVAIYNLLLIACLFFFLSFLFIFFSTILLLTAYLKLLSEILHETSHLGSKWFKVWRSRFYVCISEAMWPLSTVPSCCHLLFLFLSFSVFWLHC